MIPPLPAANLAMELNLVEGGRFLRFWGMLARTRGDLRENDIKNLSQLQSLEILQSMSVTINYHDVFDDKRGRN